MLNGANTSEREQEQEDKNPCSGQGFRWIVVDQNCNVCPKPINWQPTGQYRCVKDANGINTGEEEMEQQDLSACISPLPKRWINIGGNPNDCPLPTQVYAKLNYENQNGNYADIVVRFYSDRESTNEISVNNVIINYEEEIYNDLSGETTRNYYSIPWSGSALTLLSGTQLVEPVWYQGTTAFLYHNYYLDLSDSYIIGY